MESRSVSASSHPQAATRRRLGSRLFLAVLLLGAGLLLGAAVAGAVGPASGDQHEARNYDARVEHNVGFLAEPASSQLQAADTLRAAIPDLALTFEPTSSAVRTLYNRTGYLSEARPGVEAVDVALDYVVEQAALLGLTAADLADLEVTDDVYTRATGATHLYLRQTYRGLPLYNGQLHVNVNRDGRVISVNNAFMPRLAQAVNATRPAIDAAAAVKSAAEHLGIRLETPPALLGGERGPRQLTHVDPAGLSRGPITAQLMLLPIRDGLARLVWNFQLQTLDGQHWYDLTVDAVDGKVWTRFDWTSSAQYRVYEVPVESPNHTAPLPPADARTVAVDPDDAVASPLGWHDDGATSYSNMRGNNVHSYEDSDANNAPPASEPSCGGTLNCDFAINLSGAPSTYRPAATANLFYWNNVIHDVLYQYGFDEVGGNFQESNFGLGGAGSDSVNAEAQDGSGTCNANFSTPVDGGNPRMQMYICNNTTPAADGDLDNAVIVHEYGHGISIRQVGGPGNSSCLNNAQQPGEGWSDWFGLVLTHEVGDQGTDKRGIGTYLFGQPPTGDGIRPQPYSTDPAINSYTYASMSGLSVPHGVGSVWAQGIWEVYWELVDTYGFDPDLYNVSAGAGNHRALLYVNEGLKNTACSPTFTQTRDGIIQAAIDNFGGADVCLLWEVFAAYGLGTDAVSGGSGSTSPTNGFAVPPECQCSPFPIADAGPDQTICLGDSTVVGTPAQPDNSYSWSPGGQTTAQITVSPTATTTYTVTATTAACGSDSDSATVYVDDGTTPPGLFEDFEGGAGGWSATGLWHLATSTSCASPGYSSPVNAFYYGQEGTCNYSTGATNSGTLTSPTIVGITAASTLTFDYYRVVESFSGSYDQTQVEIVTAGGATTVFSLDSSTPSTAAWVSSGPISLAAFTGQPIQVRFRFNTVDSVSNTFTGWLVDDVEVTAESPCEGPVNTPPSVTITAPADGATFTAGTSVTFSGTAVDAEDGNLSAGLAWTSSLDGAIGSGASFSTSSLSVGTHTVTAAVTDSGGLPGSDAISVTIEPVVEPVTVTFTSIAADDGWVRESGENTNVGGNLSATGTGTAGLRIGDANNDRQFRSFVSFDTSSIPDGATVQSVTVRLRRGTVSGTNPFTTHGTCWADVQSGGFSGSNALQTGDFQAAATAVQAASLSNAAANGAWSEGAFNAAGLAAVNKTGTTQVRVYFALDDNDDSGTDYIGYYPGNNGTAANRPQLVVTYLP